MFVQCTEFRCAENNTSGLAILIDYQNSTKINRETIVARCTSNGTKIVDLCHLSVSYSEHFLTDNVPEMENSCTRNYEELRPLEN